MDRKTTKAAKWIVLCHHYDNYENVLFMMEETDFRFGKGYTPVTSGRFAKGIFTGDDGKTYRVYPDWSAKEVA